MSEQLAFVLVRETHLLTDAQLYQLARALEVNARDCAKAWGVLAPTVDVVDKLELVPGNYHPIRFMSHTDDDPGALAVHYFDPMRGGPAAIVYVDRASGFNVGRQSVAEAASHEVVEALINPRVNLWLPHPNPMRVGVQVAREVGDPTQATYDVVVDGTPWRMTSFVTPAWFDQAANDSEVKRRVLAGLGFDHAKQLRGPGDVGPEGYVILRERRGDRWHVWFEDDAGTVFGSAPTKKNAGMRSTAPSARAKLLLEQCNAEG